MEQALWNASAGISKPLPASGDLVYYFPEGHAEHTYITPDIFLSYPVHQVPTPIFLCRVAAVTLSAHPVSDEVYAKFTLDPLSSSGVSGGPVAPAAAQPRSLLPEGFAYQAKILTPSDAGNGSGFSIPRSCADLILPKLNYEIIPPTQILTFFDVHGKAWKFKHIYRGNPKRHLLTTGWNRFVERKKLEHKDTVIFIRDPGGRLFIRIRRSINNYTNPPNCFLTMDEEESAGEAGCYTRRTPFRISQKSVAVAASLASEGRRFEVLYYPMAGWPEFVVAKEKVDASRAVKWAPGMRVKLKLDTVNSNSTTGPTYHGTISCAGFRTENGRLPPSIWRLLEVEWDDHEMMEKPKLRKAVNPWQVELATTTPPLYPYLKRMKVGEGNVKNPWLLHESFIHPFLIPPFFRQHSEGCSFSASSVRGGAESSFTQASSRRINRKRKNHISFDLNSQASDISSSANVFLKTIKLFGNIIRIEGEKNDN